MAHIYGLMILLFVTAFSISQSARASNQDFSGQSPFFRDSAGNWINTKTFNSQLAAGKLTYDGQYRVQVPSTGKALPVTIPRSADVDVNRIGLAVRKFAKVAGPIGVGIAVAELICDNTDICNIDGLWKKAADPAIADFPETLPTSNRYYVAGFTDPTYPSPELGCRNAAAVDKFWGQNKTGSGSGTGQESCTVTDTVTEATFKTSIGILTGCPTNYVADGAGCTLIGNPNAEIADDQDFIDAETLLNDDEFLPHLITAGESVPVQQPDPFPPKNTIVSEKTTTLKDAEGNVTGTSVETTTLTLTDTSTEELPNQIDVKETKTVTNYDIDNNITDQSTTVVEAPPTVPPNENDDDIEFDDMEDEQLDEWEMPDVFDWESWGSGSCPANRSIDYSYGSLELSYEPACTFATDVKPIILIIAGILAMYIISGIRTE